jgi:hypothetical protein
LNQILSRLPDIEWFRAQVRQGSLQASDFIVLWRRPHADAATGAASDSPAAVSLVQGA